VANEDVLILQLLYREQANRPPLRASSDHCAFSFSLDGELDWSPTARDFLTRPPTGTPRRAISQDEGLLRPRVARAQETV